MPTVFTIGHGNRPVEDFIETLEAYDIDRLIDVRSAPYRIKESPYNKWRLPGLLADHGIDYDYLGDAFGSIQTDRNALNGEGQLSYQKYQQSPGFHRGVVALRQRLQEAEAIVLMSSPASALSCHRFSLICRYLQGEGWAIQPLHIGMNGRVFSQRHLEKRLVEFYLRESSLRYRLSWNELVEEAYRRHNRDLGWRR